MIEPHQILRCAACQRTPTEPSVTSGLEGCKGCGSRAFELVTPEPSAEDARLDAAMVRREIEHARRWGDHGLADALERVLASLEQPSVLAEAFAALAPRGR